MTGLHCQRVVLDFIYFTIQVTCKERPNEELKTTLRVNLEEPNAGNPMQVSKVFIFVGLRMRFDRRSIKVLLTYLLMQRTTQFTLNSLQLSFFC
jgi:hypothetical protein